ncbi:hypothetical protein CXF96_16675 [Stenotrophomonas sp. Betaine-02u-21]|uniref:hypothetical protein n=1 Tax=unclassified Stenotrophomonas TaxID=196198 RepID=UPI000C324055|nr:MULTISPECIES: hypothetical protein [unclassified Stenotrophomonas]PKH71821.1 hypothetical protein CXF96_16675 [Stenotrophomonas sp. Betaine-02u-21]PKH74937.1 hypothetical protein CXF90_03935 [Stenotrophomonas sp. Betaine-02u-23]PKH95885.1 hypothetical protein CXG43_11720 [Stenotrophomonas sp. Bg11-02]
MKRMSCAFALSFLSVGGTALSQNVAWDGQMAPLRERAREEFMGITLGDGLFRECPVDGRISYRPTYRLDSTDGPCWMAPSMQPGSITQPQEYEYLPVHVRDGKRPTGTRAVQVTVSGGRINAVHVSTDGFRHQGALFGQLKEKYGDPTSFETREMISGTGGKFDALSARWEKPNLHVTFSGLADQIDQGLISVYTDSGKAAAEARVQRGRSTF